MIGRDERELECDWLIGRGGRENQKVIGRFELQTYFVDTHYKIEY